MWLLVNAPPPPLFKTPPDFIIWMSCGGDDDMFEQCMYINPIKLSFAYNRIKIVYFSAHMMSSGGVFSLVHTDIFIGYTAANIQTLLL